MFVISTACLKTHRVVANFLHSRRGTSVAVLVGLVVLIPIRLVLFVSSDKEGVYSACFRPANEWAGDETCEPSYENLGRTSATRFDSVIDFGEKTEPLTGVITNTNWNLGFVNDLRFNVYPWEEGNPDLIRFPFSASWNAQLPGSDTYRTLRVSYIGEGAITLGTQTTLLESSYSGQATAEIPLPADGGSFRLDFTFDSLVSRSDPTIPGPYGQLKVEVSDGNSGDWRLLRAADVGIGIRLLAALNDLVFIAAILGLAYIGLKQNRRNLLHSGIAAGSLLIACSLGAGTLASTLGVSLPIWWVAATATVVVGLLLLRSRESLRLSLPLIATIMSFNIATRIFPNLQYVDFKGRGDDWMTYEHFARSILIERSLEGGESVFYYQPAFRYLLFGAHLLFGDGSWGVAFLLALFFTGSLAYFIWRVSRLHFGRHEIHMVALVGTFTLAALLFLYADSTILLLQFHATEIPTWGLILGAAGLLIPPTDRRRIALASGLLGLIFITRPNHLFAILIVVALLVVANRRSLQDKKTLTSIVLPFLVVSSLPLVHNLVYGRQFKILPTGSETVRDLTVGQVLTAPGDSEVMRVLGRKIELFFNQSNIASAGASLTLPIVLVALLWLAGLVLVVKRRPRAGLLWGLLAVPMGYLTTMVLYDVLIYYPRHIIAFNLGLGLFGTTVALITLNPSVGAQAVTERASSIQPQSAKRAKSRR